MSIRQYIATEKLNTMYKFEAGKMGARIEPLAPWEKTPRVTSISSTVYDKCKEVIERLLKEDKIKEFVSDPEAALKNAKGRLEKAQGTFTDLQGRDKSATDLLNLSKNTKADAQKAFDESKDKVAIAQNVFDNPPENGKTAARTALADAKREHKVFEEELKTATNDVTEAETAHTDLQGKIEKAKAELELAESQVE